MVDSQPLKLYYNDIYQKDFDSYEELYSYVSFFVSQQTFLNNVYKYYSNETDNGFEITRVLKNVPVSYETPVGIFTY
tara:strand:- start:548 stop:778 length:231 start_codon:yes stop_codon:yes gene_type:complete